MKKRIVIVLGSPRKKGNSAKLGELVANGARERGTKVETFYLNGIDIRPCHGPIPLIEGPAPIMNGCEDWFLAKRA